MTSDLGTLHAVGDRMMLRFERRMTHPVDRVWRMITEPQGLARWFPARTEYDSFEVGARITFTFEPEDIERARDAGVELVPLVSTGAIRAIEPPRVFEFDWAGELVRFELSPEGDGCRLLFTHLFDRDEAQAPRNGAGWHACLDALTAALADRPISPHERAAELQARYSRELREHS